MLKRVVKSSIIQNIIALSFVQTLNFILPLLLIPHLINTLGTNGWGRIAYIQFILQYSIVVVLYGFQWSAVKRLAPIRENKPLINRLFSAYWLVQWILLFVCLLTVVLINNLFIKDEVNSILLYIGFLSVIGTAAFPVWMMQALEKLKIMALIQFCVQLVCFVLIFNLVKSNNDINTAMFLQSINNIIVGLLCLIIIYKEGYKIIKVSFEDIKAAFQDGFSLFTSQIWISLYTNTIPLVLGYTQNANAVATYAVADKIQKAVRFVLNPIGRALFPRISYLINNDSKQAEKLLNISIIFTCIITFTGGLLLFAFTDFFIALLGAEELRNTNTVLKIFSIMPLLVGVSGTLAIQGLIPHGKANSLNKIWFASAILALLAVYPVTSHYGVIGAATLAVVIELFTVISMYILLKR